MNSLQPAIIASASPSALPNFWMGASVCVLPVAVGLLFWQARSAPHRSERILGWLGGGLITLGALGAIYVLVYPPLHYNATGHVSGEMPPEFGLSVGLVSLGLVVALGLLLVKVARRLIARAAS
ncbi:MAG TPA: hypothetical protein VM687_02060 [Stenotrophomonas sp.]|nr:hypothetical protein [Stenotrophomonas sp.]